MMNAAPRVCRPTQIALLTLALAGGAFVAGQEARSPVQAPARLAVGDGGPEVEGLQRALNARLDPSPGLTVDGDFGEGTRAAVARFQAGRGLPASGVADARTREALGPPPAADPEPPPPEVINAQPVEKRPADPLNGPPFVTARAWAVADGRTGALLAGKDEAAPLEMASTTKVMTALLVVGLARDHPAVLDEVVTFSERADKTSGSTSGVRAGERVPVRELLYGLLLPSGNDAAVAFAEHFGPRLDAPGEADPLRRFVAAMNRRAAALGLAETHFENPHGLPAAGHRSSARDLAKLAAVALADPTFARCVATTKRGCSLLGPGGTRRNVVWTNTNALLGTEGFDGVKTGTTTAAGACLIASGHRGDDHLLVVILGSSAPDARYAEARNLFRWAWARRLEDRRHP